MTNTWKWTSLIFKKTLIKFQALWAHLDGIYGSVLNSNSTHLKAYNETYAVTKP